MFHLAFLVPWLYLAVRFVAPLPWPLIARLGLTTAMLVASQYHLWCRLSSGSVFSPEFPRSLVLAFNWAFGTVLLLAVFQVAIDVVSLMISAARQGLFAVPVMARFSAAGAAAVLTVIAVVQAARVPTLRDLTVEIAGLPASFDGYQVVQLTDLHISRVFPRRWTEAVVTATNRLDADLIVVTGDFIDGTVAARRADVAPLAGLRARDGAWFIPGNHEYIFGYEAWIEHLSGLGLRPLLNEHAILVRGKGRIVLAGVTDLSAPETGNAPPDLTAALAGSPTDAPILLLDHQPKHARVAAHRGVALQLSGHTHGGMILGPDRLVARANGGFVSGRYDVDGMTLYVNNGTALWPGFALRLGRPSELTRITLRRPSRS